MEAALLGELKYEFDSLYVSTEMVQSKDYKEQPLDGLLLEACLLHFRVVWDFFYGGPTGRDLTVRAFLSVADLKQHRPKQPKRLREIRESLNIMLAHLSRERIDPKHKAREVHMVDIALMRTHTEALFSGFTAALNTTQKAALVNPLARKFRKFTTLQA